MKLWVARSSSTCTSPAWTPKPWSQLQLSESPGCRTAANSWKLAIAVLDVSAKLPALFSLLYRLLSSPQRSFATIVPDIADILPAGSKPSLPCDTHTHTQGLTESPGCLPYVLKTVLVDGMQLVLPLKVCSELYVRYFLARIASN